MGATSEPHPKLSMPSIENTPRAMTVVLLVAAVAGCPTPAQEGGLLNIDTEGFARRLQMVCNSGHADPSCPAPPDDAAVGDETVDDAGDAGSGD